jgi:hypothetical protein
MCATSVPKSVGNSPNMCATLVILKKALSNYLPSLSMGENSPNLVTLDEAEITIKAKT